MRLSNTLFIATILMASCQEPAPSIEPEIRPVKYTVIENSRGIESHTFSGYVIAKNDVALSFKVSSTINKLSVALGDRVSEGDFIASLDPTDFSIQSNQAISEKEGAIANRQSAEANLKASETQLNSAQASYNRVAKLYENNSVSLNEYQQTKANLDAAKSQYDVNKSQLNAAKTQVSSSNQQVQAAYNQVNYTKLYAPMNGVITDLKVDLNEMVGAGNAIAVISSMDEMLVEVRVPEILINKLKKGQLAIVKIPSIPDEDFKAEIVEIAFASSSSSTYAVKLKISDLIEEIRPGMTTEVNFEIDNSQVEQNDFNLAPIKSVLNGIDGSYVFKLIASEKQDVYIINKTSVTLGRITNNGYIIEGGLNQGDLVATAGLSSLFDGKEVKLLKD